MTYGSESECATYYTTALYQELLSIRSLQSVTGILADLGIPSFDNIMCHAKQTFSAQYNNCVMTCFMFLCLYFTALSSILACLLCAINKLIDWLID